MRLLLWNVLCHTANHYGWIDIFNPAVAVALLFALVICSVQDYREMTRKGTP